jgi:hypothetical protein
VAITLGADPEQGANSVGNAPIPADYTAHIILGNAHLEPYAAAMAVLNYFHILGVIDK